MEDSFVIVEEPAEDLAEVYPSRKGVDKFTEVNPALGDPSIFQKKKEGKPSPKAPFAAPVPVLDLQDNDPKRDSRSRTPTPSAVSNPSSPTAVSKEGPLWKKVRKRASAGILNHWSQRWFQLISPRKVLRYYLTDKPDPDHEGSSRGEYSLIDCRVQCFLGGKGREFGFIITCPKDLTPRAMLACSTARDLQEWLHALGEIIPIETQGLPVPMLHEGARSHSRHATAPNRIDIQDDDLHDHRESESRRRDSDNLKKSRPYLRRAVSSGHMLSDKDEIQELVRHARMSSQLDRARIEACISRLLFLGETGVLDRNQLRILFEEVSMRSGEVIAALMSQTDEEIAELGNDLLVEKSRHAALDGKVRSTDARERWSTAVRKLNVAKRLLNRPTPKAQAETDRLSERIPAHAISQIQSRANLMNEIFQVTSERSTDDRNSEMLRITVTSDVADAIDSSSEREILERHRSSTDDSLSLASLWSAVRSSKRISRELLFGRRDSPREGDERLSSPQAHSTARTWSNASTGHSHDSAPPEPLVVLENKLGESPPELKPLPRLRSTNHFKPISLLNSMRRTQSSSRIPMITVSQPPTSVNKSPTTPADKSAELRQDNSDVARTDTEESGEDFRLTEATRPKLSESECVSSVRGSSHRRNSSIDVEVFDVAVEDVDAAMTALSQNPYSSDGEYASRPASPGTSPMTSPAKLTMDALALLHCDSDEYSAIAKDLIALRGPEILPMDSDEPSGLLVRVGSDSPRSERSAQTVTSDGGSVLRSSLKGDHSGAATEKLRNVSKHVQFGDLSIRFFNYTIGESVPSDGGAPIGLGWKWEESEVLTLAVDALETFRGGDYDPLQSEPEEEWDDNWRIPREYFAEDGIIPKEQRAELLRKNGHRRPSVDLSCMTTNQLAISRRRNSRAKAAKLLISGANPDEVHAWQTEIDEAYKVRYYAIKWLQRTFPSRTFALMMS